MGQLLQGFGVVDLLWPDTPITNDLVASTAAAAADDDDDRLRISRPCLRFSSGNKKQKSFAFAPN